MSDDAQHEPRIKRRRTDPVSADEWRLLVEDRLDDGSENMRQMQSAIVALQGATEALQGAMLENTRLTLENAKTQAGTKARTDEIYEFLLAGKTIWNVFSVFGSWLSKLLKGLTVLVKWAGVIATGGLAIYAAYYAFRHNGQMPPGIGPDSIKSEPRK